MREVKQNDVKAYMTPNSVSKTYLISTSEEAIKMQLTCDQFIYFASSKRQNCDWDLTQKKKKKKRKIASVGDQSEAGDGTQKNRERKLFTLKNKTNSNTYFDSTR